MWGAWSNEILFQVRKHLPAVRLKPYSENFEGPLFAQNIFSTSLASRLKEFNLRQALFYAWVLDQIEIPTPRLKSGRAIDLGSKNFVYAPALCRFLNRRFENFELTGLEVDPYRTYVDLYKRGDYAQYYTEICVEEFKDAAVAYLPGDWLTWETPGHFDLVFCLFPFLFEDLHKRWGLSRQHFSPRRFYEKTFLQSKEVIFFHQGEAERDHSLQLIEQIGIGKIIQNFSVRENPWLQRKHSVEVLRWVDS